MRRAVVAVALVAGCDHRAPIRSCNDPLDGEFSADDRRWMILDHGSSLEAYPLFDDTKLTPAPPEIMIAPRVVDLRRSPSGVSGEVHRRYMHRADRCDAAVSVHVASCSGDTLELVVTDPVPPTGFAPCAWPLSAPSHVERWHRD